MAKPKKRTTAKPAKLDLAKIAAASVTARLGKQPSSGPGILTGMIVRPDAIAALGKTPATLAAEIAKDVSTKTGLKLTPKFVAGDGGILVGFLPPKIFDER